MLSRLLNSSRQGRVHVSVHANPLRRAGGVCRNFSATADKEQLTIFDTTLRDGEQSPGANLNTKEKLIIARQLSKLGVDVCEAGFPIASPGDFEAVKCIADEVGPNMDERGHIGYPMTIAGLSRATEKDIHRCYEAIKGAPRHRIHTFLATSDIHLEYKLKISRDECIKRSVAAVQYAHSLVDDVEFSAEDAGRSDPAFMADLFAEVIKAGAKTLNIPDTVGFTTPEDYYDLIKYLIENTKGADKVVWSTHCHNDLGLATANSLAGVRAGARQVECTINGIGERAGNTSLEEIVMTLNTRPNNYPVTSVINTRHITQTSRMVSRYTGMLVQPNKAIVGENAFAHESGIHQDGILKHAATYEIMTPESVGLGAGSLVLGKLSGRNAFKDRLVTLGFGEVAEDADQLQALFVKFKDLADKKKTIDDRDIEALAADALSQPGEMEEIWKLNKVNVSGGATIPTATISLTDAEGNIHTDAAIGAGPVEAIYKAIARVIGADIKLAHYSVSAVTSGNDALGEVNVKIVNQEDILVSDATHLDRHNDNLEFDASVPSYGGHSADVDTMKASAKAFVSAVNYMLHDKKRRVLMEGKKLAPPGRVVIH